MSKCVDGLKYQHGIKDRALERSWLRTRDIKSAICVFENRVLRRIFGPKRDAVTGNGENYIMRS
jgi:hypothetical protein